MCEIIEDENGSRRDTGWLLKIMDPAENGYLYAWEFVNSSLWLIALLSLKWQTCGIGGIRQDLCSGMSGVSYSQGMSSEFRIKFLLHTFGTILLI